MEGMVILLAGVVLLTPGFLTDEAGYLVLTPPVRECVVWWLKESLKNRVRLVVPGMGAMGTPDKAARPAGKRCGIKDSAALNLKRRIAADLIEFFGEDVIRRLLDGVRPGWESDLRTVRDRHLSLVTNAAEQSRILPHG